MEPNPPAAGTLPEDYPEFRCRIIPRSNRHDRKASLGRRAFHSVRSSDHCGSASGRYGPCSSVDRANSAATWTTRNCLLALRCIFPCSCPAPISAWRWSRRQGDGEVCLTALETCLAVRSSSCFTRESSTCRAPLRRRIYITMGLDPDLDDAAKQALRDMIAGWSR